MRIPIQPTLRAAPNVPKSLQLPDYRRDIFQTTAEFE